MHFSLEYDTDIVSPLLPFGHVNLCNGTMKLNILALHEINIAIPDPILTDLEKSGSVLRADDDRLPTWLPNLHTDIGKLSASPISGVPAGSTIM